VKRLTPEWRLQEPTGVGEAAQQERLEMPFFQASHKTGGIGGIGSAAKPHDFQIK
jgi:hypothetical protein